MRRRDLIKLAAIALFSSPTAALSQSYPSKPVRLLVGFPPGGTTDIVARLIGQWLSERLGASFVIENRAGAGTNIATEAVVRAPADGHTLLVMTPANTINVSFYDKLEFDFERDIIPVATLIRSPYVLEVSPGFPAKSVQDLVAYAKANPGKVNIASFGTGTASHLSGEMFKMMAGLHMQHVPYKGSAPMLMDLLGGQVQVAFDNLPASIEHIKAGRLRALAITTEKRAEVLPDVPTLGEFYPGFETSSWLGIGAPSKTPQAIVDLLNREINAGLADRTVRSKLADLGAAEFAGSPGEAARHISDEVEKWRTVVRASRAESR
jgi:tripartite-type tricarboxylate transporter receptor subunit TctC